MARKNRFQNAFSQIEVQLKRRYDLIPNLVNTVKGYMDHERETLEKVTQARNNALSQLGTMAKNLLSADAAAKLAQAETQLTSALGQFQIAVEAYPDLKANESVKQLQEELTSTENRVAFARQSYNDAVMSFNEFREIFPNTLFAGPFGHRKNAPYLEFEDRQSMVNAPKITL